MDGAYANFRRIAKTVFRGGQYIGVLFLADTPSENGWERLSGQSSGSHSTGEWDLLPTKERTSLHLTSEDKGSLVVIAARQIVSREDLEVLAVGTRHTFRAGKSIAALIQDIARAGALPIVPWGAGKWMGVRGQVVEQLLQSTELPHFFLGDSRNRPAIWPRPSQFRRAEERGIRDLPGSDPLPFPSEAWRPGSLGFALEGPLDLERPTQDLKDKLLDDAIPIRHFGRRESFLRFVGNQLKMQYRKRVGP